jgi:biopolymer transport protein ExbD
MKKNDPVQWLQTIRSHRHIHRFGGPWAQAVLYAVPWINVLILVVLLFLYHERIAVSPGVLFDLPSTPLREGSHTGLTALMFAVTHEVMAREEALVFFDDARYMVADDDQMAALADQVRLKIKSSTSRDFLLLADKHVRHGDIMRFVNILRNAGVSKVNVAEKPD